MAKKQKIIKLTQDGRYYAMGSVVDTIDEAIARCELKGIAGTWIHLELPEIRVGKFYQQMVIPGNPEYIKKALEGLKND